MLRIGHGYDVHRLEPGGRLVLGGREIPFEKGLAGHSDADVLVHAIMDALLGAAGLCDIGTFFPDTDERYRGASSIGLLKEVVAILKNKGYRVVNIDSTIIAQEPKLLPYISEMKKNIAHALNVDEGMVGVKATTEEKLGFTGRREGVAAHAVCLISSE